MEVLLAICEPENLEVDGMVLVPVDFGHDLPTVGTIVKVRSNDLGSAIIEALERVRPVGGRIIHVLGRDERDRLSFPLVGVSEFANMRGVTRQYASTVADKKGFPDPEAQLAATKVWHIVDVAVWLHNYDLRRTGSKNAPAAPQTVAPSNGHVAGLAPVLSPAAGNGRVS